MSEVPSLSILQELSSLQRLGRIVKARYGAEVTVKSRSELSADEMWPMQAPLFQGGILHIPLMDSYLISIEKLQELDESEISVLTDLVLLVMEPGLRSLFSAEMNVEPGAAVHTLQWGTPDLEVETPALEWGETDNENELDNVIPLFEDLMSSTAGTVYSNPEESDRLTKSLQTPALFLATTNVALFEKVAAEIHDQSSRYARLPFADVASSLNRIEDIWALGATTLVLPDLAALTPAQQDLVFYYCSQSRQIYGTHAQLNSIPLILASSQKPVAQLLIENQISVELAFEIQRCVLEVDRLPVQPQLLREALELLLEPGVIL